MNYWDIDDVIFGVRVYQIEAEGEFRKLKEDTDQLISTIKKLREERDKLISAERELRNEIKIVEELEAVKEERDAIRQILENDGSRKEWHGYQQGWKMGVKDGRRIAREKPLEDLFQFIRESIKSEEIKEWLTGEEESLIEVLSEKVKEDLLDEKYLEGLEKGRYQAFRNLAQRIKEGTISYEDFLREMTEDESIVFHFLIENITKEQIDTDDIDDRDQEARRNLAMNNSIADSIEEIIKEDEE